MWNTLCSGPAGRRKRGKIMMRTGYHQHTQRRGPLRKIMARKHPEITSRDPMFRPLVILECSHEVKSDGQIAARCSECGEEEQKCTVCKTAMRIRPWNTTAFVAFCYNWNCSNYRRPVPVLVKGVDANV